MATFVRVSGVCLAGKTPSFAMSFSANGGGGGARPFCTFPPAQRATRTVTLAAAPKPDVAAETKPRQPRGIMKPRLVSPEMREFLGGVSEIARTKALKEIWAYIKLHDLQDPADRKVIICDDKLKTIFANKDRVGFLEIAKLITPHFLK